MAGGSSVASLYIVYSEVPLGVFNCPGESLVPEPLTCIFAMVAMVISGGEGRRLSLRPGPALETGAPACSSSGSPPDRGTSAGGGAPGAAAAGVCGRCREPGRPGCRWGCVPPAGAPRTAVLRRP